MGYYRLCNGPFGLCIIGREHALNLQVRLISVQHRLCQAAHCDYLSLKIMNRMFTIVKDRISRHNQKMQRFQFD